MARLTSELILSLVDRVTAPVRNISNTIRTLEGRLAENTRRTDAMRGRMVEAAAVAYGFAAAISAPVNAATEFETKLEDIAQKVNVPVEALPRLGQAIKEVARQTTQSAAEIATGMDVLAGLGASEGAALTMLPAIGRAATAYNASVEALAQAGYAAVTNLKVPAEEFARVLDVMAQAGKAGAFELRDMATYFPALGAGYQALGQTGVGAVADLAAALQIVRSGTGDSASAATNLSNVLQKIRAPQTVEAFKKMGVDLEAELDAAARAGMSPIEAIADITNRALDGNLENLGYLFADSQVQQGLRPLIQNIEEYRKIRAEALAAQGVVEEDYQRRLKTGAMATKRWRIALEDLSLAIGTALLPALTSLADTILPVVNRVSELAEANPMLTRTVVAVTGGLIGLRIAALAAQFSLGWMRGAVLMAALGGMKALQGAVAGLNIVLRALQLNGIASGLGFASRFALIGSVLKALPGIAFGALSGVGSVLAGISAPILIAVGAVAGLALAIYNYWTPISEFVGGFASVVGREIGELAGRLGNFTTEMGAAAAKWGEQKLIDIGAWLGVDEATIRTAMEFAKTTLAASLSDMGDFVRSAFANAGTWLADIFTMNDYSEAAAASFRTAGERAAEAFVSFIGSIPSRISALMLDISPAGVALVQTLWNGAIAKFEEFLGWVRGIPARIIEAVGNIDLSNIISWPKMPNWFGGGGSGEDLEKRAAGGPVSAGQTYLVGEEGPELITPSRSGYVHTADETAAMSGGSGRAAGGRSGGGARGATTVNVSFGNINVASPPGASAREVADEMGRMVSDMIRGGQFDKEYSIR